MTEGRRVEAARVERDLRGWAHGLVAPFAGAEAGAGFAGSTAAGVAASSLRAVPNGGTMKSGTVPLLKLGAFELPSVPALSGDEPVKEREQGLGIELDGLVGSGLLANFRVTLADGGRTMWLEDMPREAFAPGNPALNIPETPDDAPDDSPEEEEAPGPAGKPGKPGAPKPAAGKAPPPAAATKPVPAAATPAAVLPAKPAPASAPAKGATKP